MSVPQFSIIIPVYNKASHVGAAIQSVLNQSFKDFEVIVVDDGSTDNSYEIIQSFDSDARVRITRQENAGVSVARNNGAALARGTYLAFLDADDFWEHERLADLSDLIEHFPTRTLFSSAHVTIRQGTILRRKNPGVRYFCGDLDSFFREYARSFSLVNSSTACMSQVAFKATGGFPVGISRGEDVIVWIKAAALGGMAFSGRELVYINEDAENRSDKDPDGRIAYYITWLDSLFKSGARSKYTSSAGRHLLKRFIIFGAMGAVIAGDREAAACFRRLFISQGFRMKFFLNLLKIVPCETLSRLRDFRHSRV